MTHLYEPGCATPYLAFTFCGETVRTLDIVTERPSCSICAAEYERQLPAELREAA